MSLNKVIWIGIPIFLLIFFSIYDGVKNDANVLSGNKYGFWAVSNQEDQNLYVRSQMMICYHNGLDDCYKDVADLFVNQFGYEAILGYFKDNEQFPEIFSRCHEVTHFIGRRAYEINSSVPDLYAHGNSACWGGFYHGVIEGYFGSKNLNPNNSGDPRIAKEIINVCGKESDYTSPRFYSECVHGVGHAMMFITKADLPLSLSWCDKLNTLSDRVTCYGGVFMENSSSSTSIDHPSKYIKKDDSFYPCDSLGEKYLDTCYQYQSSYFAKLVNYNWSENAKICSEVPKSYQAGCFTVIGSNQVGSTQDILSMSKVCKAMPTASSKRQCVSGVISGLGGRYVLNTDKMVEFCNVVSSELSDICWISFGSAIRGWYPNISSAENLCKLKDTKKSFLCLSGLKGGAFQIINK